MEIFKKMFAEKILSFHEGTNRSLEILKKMCYDNNEWGYFYQRKAIDFIYFLLWDRTVLFHELILIGNRRNHSCE